MGGSFGEGGSSILMGSILGMDTVGAAARFFLFFFGLAPGLEKRGPLTDRPRRLFLGFEMCPISS